MSEYRIGWLPRYVWITTLKPPRSANGPGSASALNAS